MCGNESRIWKKINGLENREKFVKYALDIPTQEGLESEQVKGNGSNGPLD